MVSAGITQEGLCLVRDNAAEKTKDSASLFYEVGADISGTVKGKMDETGITDGAKVAGGFVLEKGAAGVSYINDSIDQNPTLASIKTSTA